MSWMELVGLLTVVVLGLKSLWNLAQFFYTTSIGRLLGHGIELRKCGPWAGTIKQTFCCLVSISLSLIQTVFAL